jgi:WD40 repeat protein
MVTATDQFNQASAAVPFTIVITAHGFVATGSMATARRFHTATLLGNGKVLVTGGEDAGTTAFASAELYDPSTGMFTPTTGSMTAARVGHTATLLGNGKVLITGGATDASENALASAELYDPTTNMFTATGSMTSARVSHSATLLNNGKVLVAGGDVIFYNGVANTNIKSLASAEIFDPATGTFTATGSLSVARESHTATLLNDGRVLVAGGSDGTLGNPTPAATVYATAELFDPTKGTFTAAGMMTSGRDFFTASLLGSGKVLAAGGANVAGFLATADLFDPTSTSFAATGNMTATRFYHDASLLNGGTVLLTGGSDANNRALDSAEVYDPTAGTFAITGSMLSVRVWHTSTLLPNGKVLVTGGANNSSTPLATAELY